MQQSSEVANALRRFYESFSTADVEAFERLLTKGDDAVVIGTDANEWEDGRAAWLAAFEGQMSQTEGMRLEPGEVRGYEEGSLGWVVDRPTFVLAEGPTIPTRLTGVVRKEDGEWKLVHLHFSIGVPDEQLFEVAPGSSSDDA